MRRNRLLIVSSLVLLVLVAAAIPAAALEPARSNADATILLHARFNIVYKVDWIEKTGDERAPCSTWRVDRGSQVVTAKDSKWRKRGERTRERHGMPGGLVVFERPRPSLQTGGWAGGSAVGRAQSTVNRRWIQRGGVNWGPDCGSPRPPAFAPTETDCGGRTFRTRNAAMLPQLRVAVDTLEDLMTNPTPAEARRARGVWFVLAFSVPGPARPYRRCMFTGLAPYLPAHLGFNVRNLRELREIGEGETVTVQWDRRGSCVDDSPETIVACSFEVELELFLSRLGPGENLT